MQTDTPVPAYVDLQINGFVGVDFNCPTTSESDIERAASALRAIGVETALPTVITASPDVMTQCLENLCDAIERSSNVAAVFKGIHIEGPFLSREPGYIGAHPVAYASNADKGLLKELLLASRGLAKIVTLAPEVDLKGELTELCKEQGAVVAAGHTDASVRDLERCVAAGLSMFTHLGNGCPRLMDRHDNIIYRALRFSDQLKYSLIADGFHCPQTIFENLLKWVPLENLLVVSDAISAAGLGPGTYPLGERTVKIGEDGAARDASGEHFVGSASSMADADSWLKETLGLNAGLRRQLLQQNPASLIEAA